MTRTVDRLLLVAPAALVFVLLHPGSGLDAQHAGTFMGSIEDPAIAYSASEPHNPVADVNAKLKQGALQFAFDPRSGYLQSALDVLQIPVDSQLLVFSRGSLQGKRIGEQNPRALFFNDRV